MTIGEKIQARRKELGLTLEDVGNAVGVGKSTVKKWETGYIANMRRDKISALSKILQMNPAEFINVDERQLSKESQAYNLVSECLGWTLSESEQTVIENMRLLNEDGVMAVVKYSIFAVSQPEYKKEMPSVSKLA